jgi:hypothetical protein
MILAALHQRETARGRTLLDYYADILERLGGYDNVNRSIVMLGADGTAKKDRIMASLRERPPEEIGGQPVRRVLDFWDEEAFGPFLSASDRLPRNVIQVQTDAFIVTIRPSGTEPKLKLYCQLLPDEDQPTQAGGGAKLLGAVRARAEEAARQGTADLLRRIDIEVGTAALLLPDIIDLDQKLRFERETVPALRAALERGEHADLEALLAWLRERITAMTPGTDPLPAVKAPLHWLCAQWRSDGLVGPLPEALARWAQD